MSSEKIQSKIIVILPYSIQNLNWTKTNEEDGCIGLNIKISKRIKRVGWDMFHPILSEEFQEVFQISAERNFGSFNKLFNKKVKNDKDKEDIIRSLKQRCLKIKQPISNGIIDKRLFKLILNIRWSSSFTTTVEIL